MEKSLKIGRAKPYYFHTFMHSN